MIGLLFLGAILLWLTIAIALGIKLPKWLGIKRYKPLVSVLLVASIFFAPVADEIIAWPQMQALCQDAKTFRYDKAAATGKTVSKYAYPLRNEERVLFPSVKIKITEYGLRSMNGEEVIIRWTQIESVGGILQFPAGSSGTPMPLILPESCSTTPQGRIGMEALMKELNISVSDSRLELPRYVDQGVNKP